MLISRKHRIALAHFPKTAGSSLQYWMIETCPDAELLVPDNPHFAVRESLDLMRPPAFQRRLGRFSHRCLKLLSPAMADRLGPLRESLRIVGVLRDPFEMLVSLYNFWKREPQLQNTTNIFVRRAIDRTFREFLTYCVIEGGICTYEQFFDVGGPLWHNTTLLDFKSLQSALQVFCDNNGLGHAKPLPLINSSPAGKCDIQRYVEEAGTLMDDVHRHFRWYYEEGVHLAIRGRTPLQAAA
jgi:hypothetical protein